MDESDITERSVLKDCRSEREDSFYSSKETTLTEQEFHQYSQLIRDSYEQPKW